MNLEKAVNHNEHDEHAPQEVAWGTTKKQQVRSFWKATQWVINEKPES